METAIVQSDKWIISSSLIKCLPSRNCFENITLCTDDFHHNEVPIVTTNFAPRFLGETILEGPPPQQACHPHCSVVDRIVVKVLAEVNHHDYHEKN